MSCSVSCAAGVNLCYAMNQFFVDGTKCGGSGMCKNGQCVGGNPLSEVSSWIQRNKTLFIIIVTVLGSIVVFGLAGCLFQRYRRTRTKVVPAPSRAPPVQYVVPNQSYFRQPGGNSGGYSYPPPPMQQVYQQHGFQQTENWRYA